jgi:hypothetical protein
MRGWPIILGSCIAALLLAQPAMAQVVINMPPPPRQPVVESPEESATTVGEISIAGYDTYDEEALYAPASDVALIRYAGFRNHPRVTSIPWSMYGGRMYYDFNGPWVYPPIWGWPFFFTNHGFFGFPHFGHSFHHGFHHFGGGFHGHFRFGGDHFRGHIRIGF